ncbi:MULTISPECIES: phasin family protein [Microvirga]|uniref:phasin family protein n=1 Tax=Microvirga TaxID=186650 RepID=UPI001B381E52|nr:MULTISPECIES: phasin family protein [unclassified Microvirga]MBQ0820437.1 phasin family protein [Microvirga sp. HBU67558]
MAKTTDSSTETIDNRTIDSAKASDHDRAVGNGSERLAGSVSKFASGAHEAQEVMTKLFETTARAGNELSLRSITALQAESDADLSHLQALAAARTPSQMVELQSKYARQRVDMAFDHAKELQVLTGKFLFDIGKPIKEMFEVALASVGPGSRGRGPERRAEARGSAL